ncbi:1,2-phenylacetyl-CoA epoxidase subunit PaaE [Brumimicrobium aurantiacum]|uniref:Phenylacetate-CoA oxygenase/reductase subunit PaaK n=1 Tax=Brumimicrobium aurantiacum TaxID=1737063 RepID=A0A3E1EVX9_9FLAO|nr:1,2-phenylacetyl-CoA epoxidase subunit PaaE [Brumimicrobium aurantiacum]RFC53678.1 phenylacetate-CoA oxygenase/reductase subunit PaaK [Brumimicrobium aurantiacum]
MNPRFHALKVKDIRQETSDAVSIALSVPDDLKENYKYTPGQYLTFRTTIDGEDVRRSYSICTGLQENELRVAVKKMIQGKFSTFANDVLKVGEEMEVMTPMGTFTTEIDENTEKSFVFFAGGSGITPVMSLIKTILHTAKKSNVTLIYGNRGIDHVIFRDELEELKNLHMDKFSLMHVFSVEKLGNPLQEGLLDKNQIEKIYKAILEGQSIDEVFVCGPEPTIYAVKDVFEEAGFAPENVHFELFTSPTQKDKKPLPKVAAADKVEANIKVILDGEEILLNLDSEGESILDAASKMGADVPYACKGGVCCTCKAKVLEGTARMDVNYALEKDEVDAGYILTCQAHPTSDQLVVSFDD